MLNQILQIQSIYISNTEMKINFCLQYLRSVNYFLFFNNIWFQETILLLFTCNSTIYPSIKIMRSLFLYCLARFYSCSHLIIIIIPIYLSHHHTYISMSKQESFSSNTFEIKSINPPRKHERLLSIMSRNTKNCHQLPPQPFSSQLSSTKYLKIVKDLTKYKKQHLEEPKLNSDMRQTNFMSSYMERMKKQRKRQLRKKLASNVYICKNSNRQSIGNDRQTIETKNNINSMYIFLPILSTANLENKTQNSYDQINKSNKIRALATIDLFEGNSSKLRKNRTFSVDDRIIKTSRDNQQVAYGQKVQEIIQDIKKNRNKFGKEQNGTEKEPNENVAQDIRTYGIRNCANLETTSVEKHMNLVQGRKKIREAHNFLKNIASKKLEPWENQDEYEDCNRWLNGEGQQIGSFSFF